MKNKLFKWEKGRQNSGYEKMLLCRSLWPIKLDLYLLRFKKGAAIKTHTDPVEAGKHFRINFILKNAKSGGNFICENLIYESERIKFFRPDIEKHSVSKINKGTRYVISIGWIN